MRKEQEEKWWGGGGGENSFTIAYTQTPSFSSSVTSRLRCDGRKLQKNNCSTHTSRQGPKWGHSNPKQTPYWGKKKKKETYWQLFYKTVIQVVIKESVCIFKSCLDSPSFTLFSLMNYLDSFSLKISKQISFFGVFKKKKKQCSSKWRVHFYSFLKMYWLSYNCIFAYSGGTNSNYFNQLLSHW